jgi:hypothetical protein
MTRIPFENAATTLGTAEHAARITEGRHPGVVTALAWLAFAHLPDRLQDFSRPFYQTAVELIIECKDSAELTTALNKLVEAKDWAVRAGIRSDQGVPGPVPRPDHVVDPPVSVAGVLPNHPVFPTRPIRDNPQA